MFTTSVFIYFLIHSSSKDLLSTQYVPGTVLGPRALAVNKTNKNLFHHRVYSGSVLRIYEELFQTTQRNTAQYNIT